MRRLSVISLLAVLLPSALSARVLVGMTDTAAYFPLVRGQRVAVLANQTSVAEMPGAPGADAAGELDGGHFFAWSAGTGRLS